jgi:hypothetical protein
VLGTKAVGANISRVDLSEQSPSRSISIARITGRRWHALERECLEEDSRPALCGIVVLTPLLEGIEHLRLRQDGGFGEGGASIYSPGRPVFDLVSTAAASGWNAWAVTIWLRWHQSLRSVSF